MSHRLLLASGNRGKLGELNRLLSPLGIEVVAPDAVGGIPDVVEDGDTFEHNAAKKAREVAAARGMMVLADDSGLEVDALDGAPGVYSARYAGGGGDKANNDKLLAALASIPRDQRSARFRCVLAFTDPGGRLGAEVHLTRGVCEGIIGPAPRGTGGFGYDPLFELADGRTMAELSPEEKGAHSHRGRAAEHMRDFLRGYLPTR